MAFPDWIQKYRPPHSEIRLLNGVYYAYRISSKWNPQKKRAQKITHELLGKITQQEGFIPSEKRNLEKQLSVPPQTKEFGAFAIFLQLAHQEIDLLKVHFPDQWELISALIYLRMIPHAAIKMMPFHWENSFGRIAYNLKINEKMATELLHNLGEKRSTILEFKKSFFATGNCLLIDATHIFSDSQHLGINHIGYNSQHEYHTQVNMLYIFSLNEPIPVYYRLVDGSIREIRAFRLSLLECGISDAVIIGDKGFYSKINRDALESEHMQYILPLRRNHSGIQYAPIKQKGSAGCADYFFYNERTIWYYSYEIEERRVVTFLDEQLKVQESHDYLERIKSNQEEYTLQKYNEKESAFGTITLITNKKTETPEELFSFYKARGQIEQVFDTFKNLFNADRTYMQSQASLEGWLFIHFLVMRIYYKLLFRLKQKKLLSKYSPDDILCMTRYVKSFFIKNSWVTAEIPKKLNDILAKLELPIT